jgi:hypothetical protein
MSLQNIAEVISRTAVLAFAKGELHSLSLVYTDLRKSQVNPIIVHSIYCQIIRIIGSKTGQ